MINGQSESSDLLAKVVLLGPPGAGKAAIVKAVAEKYSHSSVRAGEIGEGKVFRTEFFWPQALPDGRCIRVRLFGISGEPVYHAVGELVMAEADGLVFVANLARDQGSQARAALQSMVLNARQNALDLSTIPAALHYHRPPARRTLSFEAEEMDQWLGIPPGSLPRFVSGDQDAGTLCSAVEWVVARIAEKAAPSLEVPRRRPERVASAQLR